MVELSATEGINTHFQVQYNPKGVSVDKSVSRQKHRDSREDAPMLEFNSAEPRTLSFTLLFDTFASKENVRAKYIARLEDLAGIDVSLKRPQWPLP